MRHNTNNERPGIGQYATFFVSSALFIGLLLGALIAGGANAGDIREATSPSTPQPREASVILDPSDGLRKVPIDSLRVEEPASPMSRCQGEGLVDPTNVGALNASGVTVGAFCREIFLQYAGDIARDGDAAAPDTVEPAAQYGMIVLTRYETIVNRQHLDAETIRFLEANLWGSERKLTFIAA